ncbi:hypothetical protein F0562_028036 [Nyssa sinensis]|uniref:Uncharacterized protein n=1 Tax=Nyssa sinensis TaxID=561372 RepID=A0A5J5B6W1_9ASTE|nr:hypothetical protein F0562_028036 [Nyssa sinensis]
MEGVAQTSNLPWLAMGDFNGIASQSEKKKLVEPCPAKEDAPSLEKEWETATCLILAAKDCGQLGLTIGMDQLMLEKDLIERIANPAWMDMYPEASSRKVSVAGEEDNLSRPDQSPLPLASMVVSVTEIVAVSVTREVEYLDRPELIHLPRFERRLYRQNLPILCLESTKSVKGQHRSLIHRRSVLRGQHRGFLLHETCASLPIQLRSVIDKAIIRIAFPLSIFHLSVVEKSRS